MKINFAIFSLILIFMTRVHDLRAQDQLVDLTPGSLTTVDFDPEIDFAMANSSLNSVELRKIKIPTSKILQGLATAFICIAKIAGAKTKKEKQESTCNAVSSVLQIAADACIKHKEHTLEKQQTLITQYEYDSTQDAIATLQEQYDSKAESSKLADGHVSLAENSDTKSIHFGYFQQIQDLKSDQEKMAFIDLILQNKQATETLLDEVNFATKIILIDALFEE